jgi:hypothetical protein
MAQLLYPFDVAFLGRQGPRRDDGLAVSFERVMVYPPAPQRPSAPSRWAGSAGGGDRGPWSRLLDTAVRVSEQALFPC